MNPKRFIILDRDGTINEECNHLSDPDQVKLIPGAASGLHKLRQLGLGLIVITNQSVIGSGVINNARLNEIHARMLELLELENAWLDKIYVCPHKADENCNCRKPKTGLVRKAVNEFLFDPHKSFVIGDKVCDIELGKQIGATTILLRSGYGMQYDHPDIPPDFIVDDLKESSVLIETLLRKEVDSHNVSE
jgi:D-glycero-D-manno-heptose 1,7-bisphosphate phosphatase